MRKHFWYRTLILASFIPLGVACSKAQPASKETAPAPSEAPKKEGAVAGEAKAGHEHGGHAMANGEAKAAPEEAGVHFVFPQEGAKIFAKSSVRFGVKGMTVTPAGQHIEDATRGHHHLIVDGAPIAQGQPVPFDDKHMHFGKGQTETEITLAPGTHTLTLQFANGAHLSYGPALSKTIRVEVLPAPAEQGVFFANLKDGDKVKSPFPVRFGVKGFALRPAGEDPLDKTTGHHHVIVDSDAVPFGQMVPADDKHIHFGKAQTETELSLPAGKHELQLQLADGAHTSYGPNLSTRITIEVE